MEAKPKVDMKDLEHKAQSLKKSLEFATNTEAGSIWSIIHHPGWTTPVQVALAAQMLDAMNQQASAMNGMNSALQGHVQASAQ